MFGEKIFEESSLRIGYIICFVTGISFICSLTYNHGYFWNFDAGIRILSVGDILTSYSLWVPGLVTLAFGYSLNRFLHHLEYEERRKLKKHWKLIKAFFSFIHVVVVTALAGILLAHFLLEYSFRPLVLWFVACYLWLTLASFMYSYKIFKERTNRYLLGIFLYLPLILSLMFTLGLDKAILDTQRSKPNAKLFFVHNAKPVHSAILLRHLERGLLAKAPDHHDFELFLWNDIASIEILGQTPV